MADDLRVAIRLSVDGKQAVGELKIARAELAGLSAEAKRSGLSSGLKESTAHARNLAEGMSSVSRQTVAAKSAAVNFASALRGIGPAVAAVFAAGEIKDFAREVGQAAIQLQKTQATLTFAAGSAVEAARGYEFARKEAQRLGLDVAATAQSYAKFTAASKGTALSAEEVRRVFTGVQEASRALGLSTGETENAIRALVQMLSKGKVTAEEFRGQLGDALPGATRIAAKALGVTTQEFSRMLDAGELTIGLITKLGDAFHEEFGGTAAQAARGLAAETNRLSNAWTEFLHTVADTGAISAAITSMKGLSTALRVVRELTSGLPSLLGGITTFSGLKRAQLAEIERSRPALGGNQVPGGRSAVPRQGGETPAILREAELNFEKKGLEQVLARQKAEAGAHEASLARTRALAQAHEDVARERALQEKGIARLQQEAFDDNIESIAEERQQWKEALDTISESIKERQEIEQRASGERMRVLEQQAEEQRRLMIAPFENALQGIQGSFTDAFASIFSGGVDTFSDLAGTIKSVFVRLAAEIAALLVFRPVVTGILGAVGLGGIAGALGLGGGAAGTAGAGGGSFLDLLSGGSSLSSLFGGPGLFSGLTGGINSIGQSLGFGLGPSFTGPLPAGAGTLTSASLSSILGSGAAGAGIGGLISGFLGGNTTIGAFAGGLGGIGGGLAGGALAGAAAGSVVPVIGTIIGAILGGLLGGAFKETPPRGFTIREIGAGTIREGGKKGFDPDSFDPLTTAIDKAITDLGKALEINTRGIQYWVGFREGSGFRTTVRGQGDVNFENPELLTRSIVLDELRERATTPFQKSALRRAKSGKSLKSAINRIGKDVQFRDEFEEFIETQGGSNTSAGIERALTEMDERFERMRQRALKLGLSVDGFSEAVNNAKEQFMGEFRAEFEAFIKSGSPRDLGAEIAKLEKEFSQMRSTAQALGLSLDGFEQAAGRARDELIRQHRAEITIFEAQFRAFKGGPRDFVAEISLLEDGFQKLRRTAEDLGVSLEGFHEAAQRQKRAFLIEQGASAVSQIRSNLDALGITGLRSFRNQLDVSPDVAPLDRLAAAMRQFEEGRAQAFGGDLDAVRSLPVLAQQALEIQREVFANGPQTAAFRDELTATLDGLIKNLTPAIDWEDLIVTMREVGLIQVHELQKQTAILADELSQIRRELRRPTAAAPVPTGPFYDPYLTGVIAV